MKKGIGVAGNLIVDITYPVERWPRESELVTITEGISRSTGGAVCNVAVDLARLDATVPLKTLGVIGTDGEGDYILEELEKYGNIDTSLLKRKGSTSFTAVMSNNTTKNRTFFQYRGANAFFQEDCIPWEELDIDLLHVGYILLLDALDQKDAEYGTRMARLLVRARERGIKTSIDVVTETGNRFQDLVPPALRYTDYCIINELEAQQITGVVLREEGERLYPERMREALEKMMEMGVSTWAVIHCPEGGFGLDREGSFVSCDSLRLPKGYIQGTVGAGDAFCSGVLYGAWKGWELKKAIRLGTCGAAASLSRPGATEGMAPVEQVLELEGKFSAE